MEAVAATLLVGPAEVLLEPGQKVAFQAIAYDRHGRKIGPVEAQWAFRRQGRHGRGATASFRGGEQGSVRPGRRPDSGPLGR